MLLPAFVWLEELRLNCPTVYDHIFVDEKFSLQQKTESFCLYVTEADKQIQGNKRQDVRLKQGNVFFHFSKQQSLWVQTLSC